MVSNLGVEVGHLKTARTNTLDLMRLLVVHFAPEYLDNGVLETKKKSTQVLGSPTTL